MPYWIKRHLYRAFSQAEPLLGSSERTGLLTPPYPGSFSGYTHRPGQFRAEVTASGLRLADLVCVDGPAFCLMISGRVWPTHKTAG